MATTITGITADLKLESAAFIRDLTKASQAVAANTSRMQRDLNRLQGGFATAASAAKGFVAGFITVQTVRSITRLADAAIRAGDEIGDAATKIGVGAEELQRFRYAASQADVEVGELDAALKAFIQNLSSGKITGGGGNALLAFEEYIKRIQDAPTFIEKARIAQEAFGKQYQAAMMIAAQGLDAFKKSSAEAAVIQERNVRVAQLLDAEFKRVGNAITTGFSNGILQAFGESLRTLDTDGLKKLESAFVFFGNVVGRIFTDLLNFISVDIPAGINESVKQLNSVISLYNQAVEARERAARAPSALAPNAPGSSLVQADTPVAGTIPLIDEAMVGQVKIWQDYTNAINGAGTALGQFGEVLQTDAEKRKAATQAARLHTQAEQDYASFVSQAGTPMQAYELALKKIADAQLDGAQKAILVSQAQSELVGTWLNAAGAVSGALTSLFKENKAVAIANAVINTAEAITAALKNPPGPPFSYVYAAAAAIQGAAQIATITSTNPGSSKAIKKPAAGTAKSAPAKAGDASGGRGGRGGSSSSVAVNITLEGDAGFSKTQVRSLIGQINEAVGDGATLRVN